MRVHQIGVGPKRNPASARVMEKIGMLYEGCLREHEKKWDKFEDILLYGMLKSDQLELCGRGTIK